MLEISIWYVAYDMLAWYFLIEFGFGITSDSTEDLRFDNISLLSEICSENSYRIVFSKDSPHVNVHVPVLVSVQKFNLRLIKCVNFFCRTKICQNMIFPAFEYPSGWHNLLNSMNVQDNGCQTDAFY